MQIASCVYKFLFQNVMQSIFYDKQAISNEIQAYQEYIDFLIYLINILHINITHSTNFLACFMQNFFLIHVIKADHFIIYFHNHKWLLLMMNDNINLSSESTKNFENFNDIFYDDNLITC